MLGPPPIGVALVANGLLKEGAAKELKGPPSGAPLFHPFAVVATATDSGRRSRKCRIVLDARAAAATDNTATAGRIAVAADGGAATATDADTGADAKVDAGHASPHTKAASVAAAAPGTATAAATGTATGTATTGALRSPRRRRACATAAPTHIGWLDRVRRRPAVTCGEALEVEPHNILPVR